MNQLLRSILRKLEVFISNIKNTSTDQRLKAMTMPHNYSTTSLTIGNCSQIIIIGLLHPTRVRFASRLLSLIRYPCQAPPIGTVYHSMKREGDEMLPTPDRQKGTSQLIATHTVRSLVTRDPIAGSSEFHRHCPSSRVDGTRAAEISDGIARAPGLVS